MIGITEKENAEDCLLEDFPRDNVIMDSVADILDSRKSLTPNQR